MQRAGVIVLLGTYLAIGCASAAPDTAGVAESRPPAFVEGAGGEAGSPAAEPLCVVQVCSDTCSEQTDGATCPRPLRLLNRDSLASGLAERVVIGAALCGKALSLELDLRDSAADVDLLIELDAELDSMLRLETGDCVDPVLVAENDDHTDEVERSVLSQRVKPGLYRLVAKPEQNEETGIFRLAVTAQSSTARCQKAPLNDTCETAIDLDPSLAVQTVVGTTNCAQNDTAGNLICYEDYQPDVFYRVDLRQADGPRLLEATTDLPQTNFDTLLYVLEGSHGHCFELLTCNDDVREEAFTSVGSEVAVLLAPGEYFLAVDGASGTGDFGISIRLGEPDCPDNDVCSRAMPIDPSLASQTLPADAACAVSTRANSDVEFDSPKDIYYRLDLSDAEGLTRVTVRPDFDAYSEALLTERAPGKCGEVLILRWGRDLILEPGVYYYVVSPDFETFPRGELSVQLSPVSPEQLKPCIDAEMAECANLICFPGIGLNFMRFSNCELDPSLRSCVCEAAPDCCTPVGTYDECFPVFESCQLFCPDFDVAAYCEEE